MLLLTFSYLIFQKGGAVASLKHHKGPVTTVEWCPGENSVFASGGEDDQIAIWDLAVEREELEEPDIMVHLLIGTWLLLLLVPTA